VGNLLLSRFWESTFVNNLILSRIWETTFVTNLLPSWFWETASVGNLKSSRFYITALFLTAEIAFCRAGVLLPTSIAMLNNTKVFVDFGKRMF